MSYRKWHQPSKPSHKNSTPTDRRQDLVDLGSQAAWTLFAEFKKSRFDHISINDNSVVCDNCSLWVCCDIRCEEHLTGEMFLQ